MNRNLVILSEYSSLRSPSCTICTESTFSEVFSWLVIAKVSLQTTIKKKKKLKKKKKGEKNNRKKISTRNVSNKKASR